MSTGEDRAERRGVARVGCHRTSAVFVVGCPRSGTTLLRLMLDRHPSIAIPDESHFIPRLWRQRRRYATPAELLAEVLRDPRFGRWDADAQAIRDAALARGPRSFGEVIEAVFAAYAESRGKHRWGDKSPPYLAHMPLLARLFADSQFIHLIRDGREVARSLAAHDWYPSTLLAAAAFWKREVAKARRAGRGLGTDRYLEVRYEELVARPRPVLEQLCAFLEEEYAEEMLEYMHCGIERVWTGPIGGPERVDHRHLTRPPTPALRDWREGLSVRRQRALDAAAQPLLRELGYSVQPRTARSILDVEIDQLRRLPSSLGRALRARPR